MPPGHGPTVYTGSKPDKMKMEVLRVVIFCGAISTEISAEQARELEYLARWRADLEYIKERYGAADPETETSRKSIEFSFSRLDALRVPFFLQNAALAFGEDRRRQLQTDFFSWLASREGYTVSA